MANVKIKIRPPAWTLIRRNVTFDVCLLCGRNIARSETIPATDVLASTTVIRVQTYSNTIFEITHILY